MKKFITQSLSSQKILNLLQSSVHLPINILVVGSSGVGKKLLIKEVLPQTPILEASTLEQKLLDKKINIDEYTKLILFNLDEVVNKQNFLDKLKDITVIATSRQHSVLIENYFPIKIDILPLKERKEDFNYIKQYYLNEAKKIYNTKDDIDLNIDINYIDSLSLKRHIYKYVFMYSLEENEIQTVLELFFIKMLKKNATYKKLLAYFEIPLLKSGQFLFKSQLQIAKKLDINRITLRKKLEQYKDKIDE
jgi:DNA-binding protein Fis